MNITEETKAVVRVENVDAFEPQVIRVLNKKGVCIAFVIVGGNGTSVHVNVCQEDNFEIELDKERV